MAKSAIVTAISLCAFTLSAWSADSAWQRASQFEVAPRSVLVVVVHQQGADLALQVRSQGKIISEQDGPDQAFGSEVVLLENQSASPAHYELLVRTVLQGVDAHYAIEQFASPSRFEQGAARALSEVSKAWASGARASAVLPFAKDALRSPPGTLREIAVNAYLDTLTRSGQSAAAIEFLQQQSAIDRTSRAAIADRVYRTYQLAGAQWGSLEIDPALKVIEALAIEVSTSQEWQLKVPQRTRHWLEVKINSSLGAIRIFAGRARGDQQLMKRGGDVIAATLLSIAESSDYSLRAELTEYLAGYFNLVLDRTNNVTAELYVQAEELYMRAGNRLSVAPIRNNQAYRELGRGNIEAALRLYLETLELQKTSRHLEGQAHVRARLGYLYYTLGDYRRGEIRFKESIAIYSELKLWLKLVHDQLQLAELLRAANRPDEALALLEQVRSMHSSHLTNEDRLRLFTQVAAVRADQGNIRGAEKALNDLGGLDRYKSSNWESLQKSIRLYYLLEFEIVRARIEIANNSLSSAKQRTEHSLNWLGESRREPLQQLQLLYLQLVIAERQGDEQRFIKTGDRAVSLIESVRGAVDFHTQGPAWSARTGHINKLLVAHHLLGFTKTGNQAQFERAFLLLESARARNLRDVRAAESTSKERDLADDSRREVQRANQALIRALLLEQASEPLEQRLAKAEERYQIANKSKVVVRPPVPILNSGDIRKRLNKDTQVRVLFADQSSSYMLVLSKKSSRVVQLPKEAELQLLVDGVSRELKSQSKDLSRTHKLAQLLFPIDNDAQRSANLLIESDGVLAAVPFSVLLDLQANGKAPPAVTVVPSLSELFSSDANGAVRSPSSSRRKDLVVFSDPAFSLSTEADTNSFAKWRGGLGRLPHTQVEAKSISAYFPKGGVQSFSDQGATIDNVTGVSARSARILHIAAHGFASPTDPLLLGLALANNSESHDSGLLTMEHIGAAHFENEMVIVSACDSGQGQLLNGEGLMSVARSFLASGAKATLSTLWPVSDQANAEFMKEFYYSLTQLRSDPAVALVYAQQKMKATRQFNHPSYWGAFVLHVVDGKYQPVTRAM